jgi:L-seryl-tRNA(Ser) seleniumtransferase
MSRLPDTTGVADEVIMPRIQRNEYDHAIRASGAKIVDVGVCNYAMGMGSSTNVEKWELEDAVTENTAAFAYVPWKNTQLQLDTVIDVAHEHNLPVIVDAAGTIPPTSNLSYFIDKGADLVIFSGGKAIRGPQSTGILAGRKDLVRSAALQHLDWGVFEEVWDPPSELIEKEKISGVPRHGIGRGFKVGREELAGFITALELFVDEDDEKVKEVWEERSQKIKEKLNSPTIDKIIVDDGPAKTPIDTEVRSDYLPTVYIHLDLDKSKINAWELVKSLRNEDPRIFVKADVTDKSMFAMTTMSITNEDIDYIVNRILENIE